jgi:beta-glucosidase
LALRKIYRQWRLPIYLTEHGSSSTDEVFRERDLRENLAALHRAIRHGVDLRGFYYWSLLDNFEWQFGYSKKFGLLSVDFDNDLRPRQMKPLAQVYRNICFENSIPASWDQRRGPSNPPRNRPEQTSAPLCGSSLR